MNDAEINKKIKEFFFDPAKNSKSYRVLYSRNNKTKYTVRFSPLYLARRDICYCFGINPETSKKINTGSDFGPANFAGIWLIYETLNMLSKSIEMERDDFFEKYLKVKNLDNILALGKLRNAITHFYYSLRIKDRGDWWQFSLNPRYRYLIRKDRKSSYPSNNFIVNPFIFHERFELGIAILREQLSNRKNRELREQFNDQIRRQDWVIIY